MDVAAVCCDGYVFRPVNRRDRVRANAWARRSFGRCSGNMPTEVGVPGIAPHDLRRTCAKLCRAAGGELEQIQLLLGHASVQTTERYWEPSRIWSTPPNDGIKLRLVV